MFKESIDLLKQMIKDVQAGKFDASDMEGFGDDTKINMLRAKLQASQKASDLEDELAEEDTESTDESEVEEFSIESLLGRIFAL